MRCSVPECDSLRVAGGLCYMHYARQRRHHDLSVTNRGRERTSVYAVPGFTERINRGTEWDDPTFDAVVAKFEAVGVMEEARETVWAWNVSHQHLWRR